MVKFEVGQIVLDGERPNREVDNLMGLAADETAMIGDDAEFDASAAVSRFKWHTGSYGQIGNLVLLTG